MSEEFCRVEQLIGSNIFVASTNYKWVLTYMLSYKREKVYVANYKFWHE